MWHNIEFIDSFSERRTIRYCYLLVPLDSQGALETFMLNALSENSNEKKEAIRQVRDFVNNFKSNVYLRKRREKVKAELRISISVFDPRKTFYTMRELIESIDWMEFDQTDKQYGILKEI